MNLIEALRQRLWVRMLLVLFAVVGLMSLIAGSHSPLVQISYAMIAFCCIFLAFPKRLPFGGIFMAIPIGILFVFIGVIFATREGWLITSIEYILGGVSIFGAYLVQRRRKNAKQASETN